MGIYLPNMEMPKSCGECLDIGWHYVFDCRLDDAEDGARLPNCPLVPVPQHGDLIDSNELEENCMKEDSFLAELLFRKVSNAPTIIEAEEGE